MEWKRNTLISSALVVILLVVALVTYILSKGGSCGEGSFPCGNTSVCIPQRYMCNMHVDCPSGEDEGFPTCVDLYGNVEFLNNLTRISGKSILIDTECGITGWPKECECQLKTRVFCKNLNLTEVPQGVSRNVTRMILSDNAIQNFTSNSFSNYDLELIHLRNNGISDLSVETFRGQHNLEKLFLSNNNLVSLQVGVFDDLSKLEWLYLQSNRLEHIPLAVFRNLLNLEWLILSDNRLTLQGEAFPHLPELRELYLANNDIEFISEHTFAALPELGFLDLRENRIQYVHRYAFDKLNKLAELDISFNILKFLPGVVFRNQRRLTKLSLAYNPLKSFSEGTFFWLENLLSLNLDGVEIENIDTEMFSQLRNLDFVYFKKFYYCSYAPRVPKCKPNSDGVSSFKHLLVKPVLRVTVWVVATVICVGNSLVLWGRFSSRDENRVVSLVIKNLAVSDFLMGLYLFVIGFQDTQFRNVYNQQAHKWMSSWTCTAIGAVAMVSSEVSVLILVFMSLERFFLIAIPFGTHQSVTCRTVIYSLFSIWIIGMALAAIPVLHWHGSTRFYGTNGMCFPLHIDDPFLLGWQYSAFVFLGINTFGLILIAVLYSGMFVSIFYTRRATTVCNVGDHEFAIRFFFIVLTDALCWVPIIVLKLLAMCRVNIPPDLYAWIVVFILPVNSALNPLLYTFTTPKYRSQMKRIKWPLWTIRRKSSADTESSRASSNKNLTSSTSSKTRTFRSSLKTIIQPCNITVSGKKAESATDHSV